MTNPDLVSVVIPTYYRNEWLRKAIESVLSQTYEPIEIIVVDDSGERHAEPVIKDYDVQYIAHDQNEGGNPARNSGISAATGEYIQLLDDDDRILPSKIDKQVELLKSEPSVGVVYCGIQQHNDAVFLPNKNNRGDVLAQALKITELHPCQTTTMLFDGELLRDLYPLSDRAAGDDLGLKIRAAERTEFDFINEVLVVQGDPETHRASKLEFTDEIWNIIDEFDYLYDRFDDSVRKDAVIAAYRSKGYRLLDRHWWSPTAIICFAKALYHSGSLDAQLVGALVSSIFGRPVYMLISRGYHLFSRKETSID